MSSRFAPAVATLLLASLAIACGSEDEPSNDPAPVGTTESALAPEGIEWERTTPLEAWESGVALWKGKQFAAAQEAFERAATRFGSARLWAAEAALRAERPGDALDHARALSAEGDPEGTFVEALALERLGRFDEARSIYEQILERQPEHVPARNNLGTTYYMQRDFLRAKLETEKILGYPLATDLDKSIALANLAELLALDGEFEVAEKYLEQSQDLSPEEAHPYFGLAILYDVTGRQAEALFWMETGLLLDPDGETRFATVFTYPDQAAHFDGLQHEAAGQYARARADFERLLELPRGWAPLEAAAKGRLAGLPAEGGETAAVPVARPAPHVDIRPAIEVEAAQIIGAKKQPMLPKCRRPAAQDWTF